MKTPSLLPACSAAREVPGREIPHFLGQAAGKTENTLERHILAERDQVHLVVALSPLAAGADQTSGVVELGGVFGVSAALRMPRLPTSIQLWASRAMLLTASRKCRIGGIERCGRLRPHNQIRMCSGAPRLDGSWPGRFKLGAVRLTRLKSRSVPSKYSFVQSPPCRTGIFCCTRRAVWSVGTAGGTDQSSGLQHNDRGSGRQQKRLAFAALSSLRTNHESGGQGRIDHHDFERQAVDAGHGGNVGERNVVYLADAQQVPGKSGDAGAGQFHRDPGELAPEEEPGG